jgi:hypothetical protein
MRVSELLNEKLVNDKQVVGLRDVDAVVGQPEDYIIEDELKELHPITLLQTLEQKIIPR